MGFYDLPKDQRARKVDQIHQKLLTHLKQKRAAASLPFFSDEDTYIRKAAYQAIGKIFNKHCRLRPHIISVLEKLLSEKKASVRQTTINAAGEIGINYFDTVESFFATGLFDEHHSVRNAVIGSIKKMGGKILFRS